MVSWLTANWFNLIQTAGVIGGLFYSAIARRLDTKTRRTEVILTLTEAHRDIWERLVEQPDLARILNPNADLRASPPTPVERQFVLSVILHIDVVRFAIEEGAYRSSPGMNEDLRAFLELPIPRAVAISVLPYQSPDFQEYLHAAMN